MNRTTRWAYNLGSTIQSTSRTAIGLVLCTSIAGCEGDHESHGSLDETPVTINELQSRNSSIESDTNKKSDWVELYNGSATDEDLEGFFISDDAASPKKAMLASLAIVPANGFLVLWLDDTMVSGTPLHFPFKLRGEGDHFFLSDPKGNVIRNVALPADPTGTDTTVPDVSYGAYPDGSTIYSWCSTPTPGAPNAADCVVDAGI